ncbi:MAG: hypothetical protein EOS06_25885 [Mesorhizobium sp.]|nr:MAG: hypothetical protein EOS06_25885 [Mesorhizobium sp.]
MSCRTSPPQGGRLAMSLWAPSLRRRRLAKAVPTSDFPQVGEMSGRTEGGASLRHQRFCTVVTL